jgi:hypothetical protein
VNTSFSNIIRGNPAEEPGVFGDPDDHLRLAVVFGRLAEKRGLRGDEVRACQSEPRWGERLEALKRLLRRDDLAGITFHDIDALAVGQHGASTTWDDARLVDARRATFEVLADAAVRLQWTLVRPAPGTSTNQALRIRGVKVEATPVLAPELEQILAALLTKGVLTPGQWEDEVDAAQARDDNANLALLAKADSLLSAEARDAALHLALPRGEQPWNGVAGPFTLADELLNTGDALAKPTLSRQGAIELADLGLLHSCGGRIRMPRVAREFYAARAAHTGDVDHDRVQAWLARTVVPAGDAGDIDLERHHHAILSGDATLALEPGFPYRQDLRILGTNIGRQGGLANWRAAFKVFEFILQHDPEDAYAWEYSGYNLALANPDSRSPELRARVQRAYEQAVRYDGDNPLFLGRLLGWRGQWGGDVVDELHHHILALGTRSVAAVWLAHQALSGLRRGKQFDQLSRLRAQLGDAAIESWLRRERV